MTAATRVPEKIPPDRNRKRLEIAAFSGAAIAAPAAMFENTLGSAKKRLLTKSILFC
jgi:hypothetical protein